MLKVSKRVLQTHRLISKDFNYQQRKLFGARIIKFIEKTKLFERDISWGKFYILKEDDSDKKKNDRTFIKPNVKHREINYIKDIQVRKDFGKIARLIKINHTNSIGFEPGKSIKDIKGITAESVMCVDLEEAFTQISYNEILFLLNKTLTINLETAIKLAQTMTYKGYGIQGHPMMPKIFNMMSYALISRLSKITKVIQYADDITIFGKYKFMSHKFKKFILSIIKDAGWKINPKKSSFQRDIIHTLGLTLNLNNGHISPKNGCKNRRLLRRMDIRFNLEYSETMIFLGRIFWFNFNWSNNYYKQHFTIIPNKIHENLLTNRTKKSKKLLF